MDGDTRIPKTEPEESFELEEVSLEDSPPSRDDQDLVKRGFFQVIGETFAGVFRTLQRWGPLLLKLLSVSVLITGTVAVGAWLLYKKYSAPSKRFLELRIDQTDAIVVDFTDEDFGTVPRTEPRETFNFSEDSILIGAWRRARPLPYPN